MLKIKKGRCSYINNKYKKIDWSNTQVREDNLNTNNNKLDVSLKEAEMLYMNCLNKKCFS